MFFFSPCSLWQACWFPPGNISVAQNLWLVDKLKTAFNDQLPSGIHCHCFWNKVARLLEYTLWSQLPPIRQVLSKCLRVEPTLGCCPYPYGLWYFHSKTGSKQHNGRESGECVCRWLSHISGKIDITWVSGTFFLGPAYSVKIIQHTEGDSLTHSSNHPSIYPSIHPFIHPSLHWFFSFIHTLVNSFIQ